MPIRQAKISTEINDVLHVALLRTIAAPRLKTYMAAADQDRNRALALYLWNAAVGQSFHFPLQAVEVGLRNCINPHLCSAFGASWWDATLFRTWVTHERAAEIDLAVKRLRARGKPVVTDQVVATLSFGFWVGMLQRRYNPGLWNKQIRVAFPNFPTNQHHESIYRTAESIAELRNRIFHHEPVIGRNISGDYANILTLMKWMCPETEKWVRQHSSVPVVLRMKP
jgi:hypothetical protein